MPGMVPPLAPTRSSRSPYRCRRCGQRLMTRRSQSMSRARLSRRYWSQSAGFHGKARSSAAARNLSWTSRAFKCSSSWVRISSCRASPAPRTHSGSTMHDLISPTTAGPDWRDHSTSRPSRFPASQDLRRRMNRAAPTRAATSSSEERTTHPKRSVSSRECRAESRDTMIARGSSAMGTPVGTASGPPPLESNRTAGRRTVPAPAAAHTHRRPLSSSRSAASPATRNSRPAPIDQSIHAAVILLPPSRGGPCPPGACPATREALPRPRETAALQTRVGS